MFRGLSFELFDFISLDSLYFKIVAIIVICWTSFQEYLEKKELPFFEGFQLLIVIEMWISFGSYQEADNIFQNFLNIPFFSFANLKSSSHIMSYSYFDIHLSFNAEWFLCSVNSDTDMLHCSKLNSFVLTIHQIIFVNFFLYTYWSCL
jgi:hypothetical protein